MSGGKECHLEDISEQQVTSVGQRGPLSWQLLEALALSLERQSRGIHPSAPSIYQWLRASLEALTPWTICPSMGSPWRTLQSEEALCTDAGVQQHAR